MSRSRTRTVRERWAAAGSTGNRRHFVRLHRANPAHAGIVADTEDLDFLALAARIHAAASSVATLAGQLIRVNKPNP